MSMDWNIWLPEIGEGLLSLALMAACFQIIAGVFAHLKKDDPRMTKVAERALFATTILLSLCVLNVWTNFLTDNFLMRYVYGYSNRAMPALYKITALWGGQDGSLLFWVWITSLYASLSVYFHRERDRSLVPIAVSVFGVILAFFGFLLLYHENPFRLFPEVPVDGRGLNPLLQNPSMAIHPPSLYLGYTGMSVPFAFAMSALITNQLDTRWIRSSRIWTLIAWFFLSIGNLLGAQWAYVELGWGGFWGWDPVENAAFMPWLTASAFLHSVMIQEKRGMLKFWNMNLISLSFCLTILGTYLTRSGVVQSVHSFARSTIGYYFLGFLILTIVFSAFYIFKRRNELRSENIFESFLSKESAFVLNNIVLVGAAFIVLWCTLFPSASELLIGRRIVVGPPFFNKMLAPIGIVLLILTGVGPIIAWRKATQSNFQRSFLWPLVIAFVAMGAGLLLRIDSWFVLWTFFGSAFVVSTLIQEFYRGTHVRMLQLSENWWTALVRTTLKNNRRYGGYIVHVGIVFIFLGIAGTHFKEIFEFDLRKGDSILFHNYSIQLEGFENRESANQVEAYANLSVFENGQFLSRARPARFFYKNPEQPTTEVDIISRPFEDLYFTLGNFDPEKEVARIQVTWNPLISFLWLGGLILVFGGLITMLPPFKKKGASV